MALVNLLLAIWQSVVALIALIIAIIAGIQYRKKKSRVALHLFVAFIVVTIAALMQCTTTVVSYIRTDHIPTLPELTGYYWVDLLVVTPWSSYQFAYYFLAAAVYFFYLFSLDLIFEEGTKKAVRIIPFIFVIIFVVYGMFIRDKLPESDVMDIIGGIDIWIGIYIIVLMIPLIVDSSRVMRKLDAGDPMRSRFISITIFTSSLLVMIISFVAETILAIFTESPNAFSFIAWIFAVSALIFAYFGLYRKR